jgi:hypothetical protein
MRQEPHNEPCLARTRSHVEDAPVAHEKPASRHLVCRAGKRCVTRIKQKSNVPLSPIIKPHKGVLEGGSGDLHTLLQPDSLFIGDAYLNHDDAQVLLVE